MMFKNLILKYVNILVYNTFLLFTFVSCVSASTPPTKDLPKINTSAEKPQPKIIIGNERTSLYLPKLKGKKVGLVGNQTSVIGKTHLVDSLLALKVNMIAVYSPEHGFRGDADAGETIKNGKDAKTGLPIYSLYGNNKKPTKEQLNGVEIMLFDLQDVGVRFYTYISTLHYVMEACAENNIPLILLDKPNPNAHYIDGPILEEKWKSFVGMHPVPIVYGMTIGEYGQMINGERWLANGVQCDLTVIPCESYTHNTPYSLPIAPSPNLRTDAAIYLYPSLCLFEGTSVSVGRGTDKPFEVYGHPNFPSVSDYHHIPLLPEPDYTFTPVSGFGAKDPLWKNKQCNGFLLDVNSVHFNSPFKNAHFRIEYLINANRLLKKAGVPFITSANFFDKLAGTSTLREQILAEKPEVEIRAGWEKGLKEFEGVRKKYLIYE